jgi:RNA polymerase sigma-70 factor (ECF subfamily)
MNDDPEVTGLLSLMLFQHSRRDARLDASGALLTLEEQDRAAWDAADIAEARRLLADAERRERPGAYQLQAAIAAVHATAPSAAATDWDAIVLLYDRLLELAPTYVIEFNRAIALGMAQGAEAGLAAIDRVGGDVGHLRAAARADLLERAGRTAEAAVEYRAAIAAAPTDAEQRALARRLAAIER